MLVLSRKIGEQIHIGSGIVVTVLEIQGQRVKIGIDAPRNCRILRGELNTWRDDASDSMPAPTEHLVAWLPAGGCDLGSANLGAAVMH